MPERRVGRLRSVRARITLITAVVVALSGVLGGAAFALVLSASLLDQATVAAEAELERFEAVVDDGGAAALAEAEGYGQLVRGGVVVGATDELDDAGPLVGGGADSSDDGGARVVSVPGDDDSLVIVTAATDEGLLIAGVDDGPRSEAVGTVSLLLAVAVPLLVAAMALITWVAVGRALRPVERIRHDTEQVTADGLDRRIESPGTGDEIDRLAGTMNRMLDHLDRSQHRQRRFVSDASHELRSPLSALRQSAEVAIAYPASMPPERLARTVAEESERMAALVDGLLLLARADERALLADPREVDLDDLVLAEARRLRDTVPPGLAVDASGVSAVRVHGDAAMLARALRNLGDNARRHARSRITLSCAIEHGVAVVRVADDGSGIPEADRERVFERFERLDESRARDSGGSGLGLAIVRSIARAHGGDATAVAPAAPVPGAPAPGATAGALLELRLPAAPV